MTDKELLEKAAKAAGYDEWDFFANDGYMNVYDDEGRQEAWNPLTDDGDALRLAVKLGMLFTYMKERFDIFQKFYLEELDNDLKPSEATRRAVVRAAAAIGEQL